MYEQDNRISDPVEVLRRAKERLEQPGAWTQDGFAFKRDSLYGRVQCRPTDPEASQWCAMGSVGAEEPWITMDARIAAYEALGRAIPDGASSVAAWNDEPRRTLDDVLALYDRAISRVPVHV